MKYFATIFIVSIVLGVSLAAPTTGAANTGDVGTEHNFAKYNNDTVTDYGVPYDYDSVMHYSDTAFSKNGNKTIIPVQENVSIGQRNGLSESDILKLNKMYCEQSETEDVKELPK